MSSGCNGPRMLSASSADGFSIPRTDGETSRRSRGKLFCVGGDIVDTSLCSGACVSRCIGRCGAGGGMESDRGREGGD